MLRRKKGEYTFVDQTRKTKDGVALGDRTDFISDCIKSAKKKSINIRGSKSKR